MTSCLQSGVPSMAQFDQQQTSPLSSQSPGPVWQFNGTIKVKQEQLDEARNDSGVTSCSPSISPSSDRSDNITFPTQGSSTETQNMVNGIYNKSQVPGYSDWYKNNFMHGKDVNSNTTSTETSRKSPKVESGDENSMEYDEQAIRIPKVNSHGKVKLHKCKQCDFVGCTKLEFWEHSAIHIKGDKMLKCPKCPFITEYKHHLEYHLLNHAGAKPFKCDHCDYSCVNKSMLNSHLKSHSKIYQYRCSDCLYETKYCHSLKLHLRKYSHKPAMVLNPDGSPNPLPIIDVYGTRRGPKVKKISESSGGSPPAPTVEQPQFPFTPLMNPLMNQNPMLPFPLPLIPGFPGMIPNPEMIENFQKMIRERLEEMTRQNDKPAAQQEVLDLTNKPPSHTGSDDDETMTTAFENVEVVENKSVESSAEAQRKENELSAEGSSKTTSNKYAFECQYCNISFGDEVMYRIHMGHHGYRNPFTCNMCGEQCANKVDFFLHIARAAH